MNKRKILFLAHSQSIHIKRWVGYFVKNNWDVHIISFHPAQIEGASNYNLAAGNIKATGNNFKYILYLPKILFWVYRIKPDVLNSHFLSSFGLLAYLTFYKNHYVSLQGTDILINAKSSRTRKWMFQKVLNASVHIFSVSDKMSHFVHKEFKQPEHKITTLQYGVNTAIFNSYTSWDEREYTFITNRIFIDNSNYRFMLSALGTVKKSFPDFKMRIVGTGPQKNRIVQWIEENQLSSNIQLSDPVSEGKMVELLNASKFFLSFTSSEGTPLSLFEAAACGCYPVLSANDSNIEWTQKGLKGHIINLGHKNQTSETIINMLKNQNDSFQGANKKFVNEHMNYETNMKIISNKMAD